MSTHASTPADPPTAVVTGASRGFGRAIAAALVAGGHTVIGVARSEPDLRAVQAELGDRFVPVVADATSETVAAQVLDQHRPGLLVLNAGARPPLAALPDQTWETFSRNWQTDTRQAFTWTRQALRLPLAPGSVVVLMSSGAALAGSPLSGGYAGAKAAIRFIRDYAAAESGRTRLDLRFVTVLPKLTPATGLGAAAVAGYAARAGIATDVYTKDLQPVLDPGQLAAAVVTVAADPASAPEYLVSGAGYRAVS
ncbi:MAG: SDR family oxidoreductase [Actinobacteria bacterium]|nr:SDR family oxidoreductase [Actinomycetota bacterium]